jgi:hypothetical protein
MTRKKEGRRSPFSIVHMMSPGRASRIPYASYPSDHLVELLRTPCVRTSQNAHKANFAEHPSLV